MDSGGFASGIIVPDLDRCEGLDGKEEGRVIIEQVAAWSHFDWACGRVEDEVIAGAGMGGADVVKAGQTESNALSFHLQFHY